MPTSHSAEDSNLLFDEIDVAVLVIGRDDGIIRLVNRHVPKDLGKSITEIQGSHYRQVFWPEFISVYDRLASSCEDGQQHSAIYYWAEMTIWEQISGRMIVWGGTPCILMSITNISEIARSEYKFENMAYFDNLLKLPNGAKLEEDLNELANIETVALIYFEIERFEDINELYGWENGDNLLKQIRDWLLASEFRRTQLYRVNNGFAILGRSVTMDDAADRSREILQRFKEPWTFSTGGNSLQRHVTVKLGIVFGKYIRNGMRNVLLRTIRTPKNPDTGFSVYDEQADRNARRSVEIRSSLVNCIFNGMKGFSVHYQPIVDARTERWAALEALCRWTRPGGESVPPVEFIRLAEQMGLIDHVDRWVRVTAMRQCVALGLDQREFVLDVNFSPIQKLGSAFIGHLLKSLDETGFPSHKLNLEITESAKMSFDTATLEGLNLLREHGVILSLDDFGTGYSSFANLFKVSARTLKADKLFLEGILHDDYRQYLLHILVDIAHYLKMRLIAEGVETQEQFELVKEYRVDYVQGYLFSKPLTYEQLESELWRFG